MGRSFTPGPWGLEEDHIAGIVQYDITSAEYGELAVAFDKTDARLIAAAPLLLDAAKRWLHECDLYNVPPRQAALDAERDLRAAIARAEGDS